MTGIVVFCWITPASCDSNSGERCMTTTNASPVSGFMSPKNCCKGATPPADAPRPITAEGSFGSRRFLAPSRAFFVVSSVADGSSAAEEAFSGISVVSLPQLALRDNGRHPLFVNVLDMQVWLDGPLQTMTRPARL